MLKKKRFSKVVFGIFALLLLAACGDSDDSTADGTSEDNEEVDYGEEVNYTITGIEPGAGISVTTERALEEYENLEGWEVELSSTGAMMAELGTAIQNEDPIIITGWNPHWMFAQYPDMKYLEDPQEVYGGEETINSLARLELEDDNPDAYKFIDQFEWDVEDMEDIMLEAEETGEDISDISAQWVEDNQDKVSAWSEGVEEGDGAEIEIASTPWDSERASSGVLKAAMEEHGFNVTVTDVDVAVVFESVASGDVDATVAAWLPVTHKDFYESHEENFVDLGPNLEGAKIGIVVPEYMDIDSIEDLQSN